MNIVRRLVLSVVEGLGEALEGLVEFYSATAKTTEQAKSLVENGFEYICTTPQELMLFKAQITLHTYSSGKN